MKTKLVLWGSNSQEERILVALELRAEDNKVDIYTFPEEAATEEFTQKMLKEWRENQVVEFPDGHTRMERELAVTEGLLPEDIKVERVDVIQRAQTEWHFLVLSSKLNQAYQSELEDLKERVEKLESFDTDIWDSLKAFWDKVQNQVRDRNLFRDHADILRDNTNALFSHMKELRSKLDQEFQHVSRKNFDRFIELLEDVEKRVTEGARLQPIFEELKGLQRKFRDTDFTRDHRSKIWDRLDAAFKTVKEKRFGSGSGDDRSPGDRLKRRYDGLMSAIDKMRKSIKRDESELEFETRKVAASEGQLEAQIRQAKIKMIEERIRSKEEKLKEMMQTKVELDSRLEAQKEREAKRLEKEKLEQAKKEAEKKIAEEIKAAAEARKEEEVKLEKAAEAIVGEKEPEKETAPETPEKQVEEVAAEKEPEKEPAAETPEKQVEEIAVEKEPEKEPAPEMPEKEEEEITAEKEPEKEPALEAPEKEVEEKAAEKEPEKEPAPETDEKQVEEIADEKEPEKKPAPKAPKKEAGKKTAAKKEKSAKKVDTGEMIEEAVDTVKAVAQIVGDAIQESVDGLKEKLVEIAPEQPASEEEEREE
jgi:hypothetical protein